MFGQERKVNLNAVLLVIVGALVLVLSAWALIYFFLLDQYVREQARSIGDLQARVQALQEKVDNQDQDINDLYDQLNGSGSDNTDQPPTGGIAPPAPRQPGTHT